MKKIRMSRSVAALLIAFGCQTALAATNDPETPTTINGAKVVSVDEAKGLMGSAKFYDTRNALNFGKGHLPGAVQVSGKWKSDTTPDANLSADEMDVSKLPGDKAAKMVFYSDGPKGWKSYKAALMTVKAGYKNVMWMRGGLSEWEVKGYPVEK